MEFLFLKKNVTMMCDTHNKKYEITDMRKQAMNSCKPPLCGLSFGFVIKDLFGRLIVDL